MGLYMWYTDGLGAMLGPMLLGRLAQASSALFASRAAALTGVATALWYFCLVPEMRGRNKNSAKSAQE